MKQNTSSTQETQSEQSSANQDKVAQRAYELWAAGGQVAGRDLEYWLQAEAELRSGKTASQTSRSQMNTAQSKPTPANNGQSQSSSDPAPSAPASSPTGGFQAKNKKSKNGDADLTGSRVGNGR